MIIFLYNFEDAETVTGFKDLQRRRIKALLNRNIRERNILTSKT